MDEQRAVERRVSEACERAVKKWGAAAQWRQLQEECAELIAAINQADRGRLEIEELAEEVADVVIMIGQARLMLGPVVDEAVLRKLERLEIRLDESEVEDA